MGDGSVIKVVDAIQARYADAYKERKQFRTRQDSIYNEGQLQFKLREQLQMTLDKLEANPSIKSIRIQVMPDCIPFLPTVLPALNCIYVMCPEPGEVILSRRVQYI